ncbi:MAG: RdgB/HAM1 family non-canonical purine NTP pyrophosphatase [Flavobacteriaceae bacterium]|jgi:XTP/dITP diphosphohydrolase|nr:RdgB/HAM1 family non-canonical purine NTP pyrophosphatase [Flavobacteriaceae bacterium]NVJ73435.1 RdgB/HAM1 family non-canonical purine NTP pyrophosphatase [Flavobacteriaceae bacterium]
MPLKSSILVFATNNLHKLEEIRKITTDSIQIVSLKDCGFNSDIEETKDSLEGNAKLKAETVFMATGHPCFADDTGLFVNALDGAPGIYSARFAGENAKDQDNVQLLLKKLEGEADRSAHFKTVISLVTEKENYLFSGEIHGTITEQPIGENGFGYDPVFIPEGFDQTFAQLDSSIKNKISHRAKATAALIEFINQLK